MATEKRSGTGTGIGIKIFFALVILGFFAAGAAAMNYFVNHRAETAELDEKGVVVEADVLSATEIRTRRSRYTELSVSYEPPDSQEFIALEFATVQDCSSARYEPGTETVDVIFLPDDPETIRLVDCKSTFDTEWLPAMAGVLFLGFGLFAAWRTRGLWRS
jgi:Protein of unknown function (DUF3592)